MILSALTDSVVGKLAEVPLRPAVEFLEKYLSDRRSFSHARERLRAKYESAVQPSSYDFIVENFFISKQDFVDYFQSRESRTATALDRFLKDRLLQRASLWQHNRPSDALYMQMIDDFYEAYFSYYITSDPQLCNLQTNDMSQEILRKVVDIHSLVRSMQTGQPDSIQRDAFADILLALKVASIPYSVVEETPDHIDLSLIDPSSLLPASMYASIVQGGISEALVDEVKARAAAEGMFTHLILVAPVHHATVVEYGRRRGVQVFTASAFMSLLTHPSGSRPFLIGKLGSQNLKRALHIDEAYIQPDVVLATPGDDMETRYFNERINSDEFIDGFLGRPGSGVLIVLGNYGAGKSALAAHTLDRLSQDPSDVAPAYVPMRDLSSADDIVAVTRQCVGVLRSVFPQRRHYVTILDGLDEMPNAMDGTERKRNMQAIWRAASHATKLIVMVRVSYFAGLTDFWSFFSMAGESSLWSKLATHLPSGTDRPHLQAVLIRDFDSAQIQRYVESAFGPEGASEYFDQLKANDLDGTYERLQRNPLYLYLILKTRPWEDTSVECFCDVIEQFINYWLERDVEKGPSRWLLSTADRRDFIRAMSVHLFESNRFVIDVGYFHSYVRSYFALAPEDQSASSLVLDLQTTGIFAIVGNSMTFSLRAYADFFIAKRLASGNPLWDRLPDAYQARMWLGLIETKSCDDWAPRSDKHQAWFTKMGIGAPVAKNLEIDSRGILTARAAGGTKLKINADDFRWLREVLRRIFALAALPRRSTLVPDLADEIRDTIVVVLRIENKLGLHARASAKLTQAARKALGDGPLNQRHSGTNQGSPSISLVRLGRSVDARSILGVMMLAAGPGNELEITFSNCRHKQAMYFLTEIVAIPEREIDGIWVTKFGEPQ